MLNAEDNKIECDFLEKRRIETVIKKRNTIGFIIFLLLLATSFFDYISSTFVLMISIPMMSSIILLNSFIDKDVGNNASRIVILSLFLIVISYKFYSNQIDHRINSKKAYNLCIKKTDDSYLCSEIDNILNPSYSKNDD